MRGRHKIEIASSKWRHFFQTTPERLARRADKAVPLPAKHVMDPQALRLCMVITYSKSKDQPDKVANPARSRLRIWSRKTGLAAPSRVSLLISILSKLVLTYGIPPNFRGGVHLFI